MRLADNVLLVLLIGVTSGCARTPSPLPGAAAASDAAVAPAPPRLSSAPPDAHAALGPIERRLFPPELVMENQTDLGVTPEQKAKLVDEAARGRAEIVRLQWELQAEKAQLVKLLEPDHVDEAQVQAAAARLMERETKVKTSHLAMLVRVKNVLTAQQQAKLAELRAKAAPVPSGLPVPPRPSAVQAPWAPRPAKPDAGPPQRLHLNRDKGDPWSDPGAVY